MVDQTSPAAAVAPILLPESISDANTGGNPRFFWVTNKGVTTFPGNLDTALTPSVKICKVVNNIATTTCPVLISGAQLTLTPDNLAANPPIYGFWRGRWNTKTPALRVTDDYRMSVMIGNKLLGYQDVDLVATSGETKNPRVGFIAIVNGSSLDFKFRIEAGATAPNVSFSPDSLVFQTVLVGNSSTKPVTIKNVGVSMLALTGTGLSGANAGDFSATLSGCGSLAPQATCTANVTFRPTALGPRAATLSLTTTGATVAQTLALTSGPASQAINRPPRLPHSIIAFPVRDFISGAGYAATDRVTVSILRGGLRVGFVNNVIPQDDPSTPEFDGLVDVNHPGGVCWENSVPDIRVGDLVRLETAPGVGDETFVQGVTVTQPATIVRRATLDAAGNSNADGVIEVHGRAMDLQTNQRLDPAQFEARLISKGNTFTFNGKRSLRAGGAGGKDGTLTFDTTDPNNGLWTARFSGLTQRDLDLAEAAESRALWLGRDPVTSSEMTIYEFGQFPGFAGGCVGPVTGFAGPLAAPAPASLTFNEQGLYDPENPGTNPASAPQIITLSNGGGIALNISGVSLSGSGSADFLIDTNTCTGTSVAPNGACTVGVHFQPTSGGLRNAQLNFVDNADNTPQSVTLTGNLNSVTPGPIHEPPQDPHALFVFPSRDFVSAEGYGPNDRVKVEILRGGVQIGVANNVVPKDDLGTPGFDGLVDVNHPGGACWEGVTPDLRPGDVVRYTTNFGVVDQTTTQNLVVTQPATQGRNADGSPASSVVMTGYALGQDNLRLPLDQFEARIIAKGNTFGINGRRSLRAGGLGVREGTLTYDTANPNDGRWTAVFPGLSQSDIDLAASVESRGVWLGRIPAALTESTIYEYGAGGGPVGCAAPLNVPTASLSPLSLDFGAVTLGSTTAARSVSLTTSSPASISSLSVVGIDPGEFTVDRGACVNPSSTSCTFRVTFMPAGLGIRTAGVMIVDSADGSPHFLPVRGEGVVAPPPNRPPVGVNDYVSGHAGRVQTLNVLTNDTDPDGDPLSVTGVSNGTNGVASCTPGGACTYTPDIGYFGTTYFAYTISDGRGGSTNATVTVNLTNARPTSQGDNDRTVESRAVSTNVLANDTDSDNDPLSVISATQGTNGAVSCTSSSCTYTPNPGFFGTDSYTYTVSDGFESATATVSVMVDPMAKAIDDGPINIPLSSFDPAVGAFIDSATLLANDTGRGLIVTSNSSSSSGGSATCTATGCTFKPSNSGSATFNYTVQDFYDNNATATVQLNFTQP
ncbi:Ig-like domain-containing protein [Deinococcus aerolatus]|uniref:Ig-like domain-containing protein n=1 Tax=Deinococcus aerolatus TaxID=522487 RepID=UPI0016631EF6|nr:choice-of-anchor D domain-containing protein [Deinococcus aerolatus]